MQYTGVGCSLTPGTLTSAGVIVSQGTFSEFSCVAEKCESATWQLTSTTFEEQGDAESNGRYKNDASSRGEKGVPPIAVATACKESLQPRTSHEFGPESKRDDRNSTWNSSTNSRTSCTPEGVCVGFQYQYTGLHFHEWRKWGFPGGANRDGPAATQCRRKKACGRANILIALFPQSVKCSVSKGTRGQIMK